MKGKNCENIAYIRFIDESGFPGGGIYFAAIAAYGYIFAEYLPVGDGWVKGTPNWTNSIETAALATLTEQLNKYKPHKYILDIRTNNGGYIYTSDAWGALFGGNRPSAIVADPTFAFNGDGSKDNLGYVESGYNSTNGAMQNNVEIYSTLNTEAFAKIYPKAMVRSHCSKKDLDVVILTSTRAASGGDLFSHSFMSSDPSTNIHDIGYGVKVSIVGDIDGRLVGAVRGADAPPINPNGWDLKVGNDNVTSIYMVAETSGAFTDPVGYIVNSVERTIPAKLIQTWYDNLMWKDIGLLNPSDSKTPIDKYPLKRKCPSRRVRSTWRDFMLETALVYRTSKHQ